jgi:HlyD family secretion protein
MLVAGIATWGATRPVAPASGPVIAESGGTTMRAEARPARRATLSVISPGTVEALQVEAGQAVDSRTPIARVQGPSGAELVVAPWRGTVTTIQVHAGDTLQPGAVVATVADLSQLQVETVDVDEFQVARLQAGQMVSLTIDALNQTIPGRIKSVALEPLVSTTGDANYLVVIDPMARPTDLRSGMTIRVRTNT